MTEDQFLSNAVGTTALVERTTPKQEAKAQTDSAKKPFIGIGMEAFPINLADLIANSEISYVKFNINVTGDAELLEDKNKRKPKNAKTTAAAPNVSSTDFDRTKANFTARPRSYRIDSFVFLPMPNDVTIVDNIKYEDGQVGIVGDISTAVATGNVNGLLTSIGAKGLSLLKEGLTAAAKRTGSKSLSVTDALVKGGATDAGRLARVAFNKKKEALFDDVGRREFNFTYTFAPKSKEEADRLINLIKLFRYHSYPELIGGPAGGFYQFPSEFDITYMRGGKVNTSLPRISTCVLSSVSVNYTPNNGWMNLPNGFPPVINFSLRFNELETLDETRIAEGF